MHLSQPYQQQALSSVSVLIVNFNAGPLLSKCVSSIAPHVLEVLVIDNGSTDNSLEQCRQLGLEEHKLRIVPRQFNAGFASSCNLALQQAAGSRLLFLNPDAEIDGEAIARLLEVLESDPLIGMVGPCLLNTDGGEQRGGRRQMPNLKNSALRFFEGTLGKSGKWGGFDLHRQPLPNSPIPVDAVSGACMLVRREAVEYVGQWDERFFLHCEDLDWCLRFRQAHFKVVFVPNATVYHVGGACSSGEAAFVERCKHKSMLLFYRKHYRRWYQTALYPVVYALVHAHLWSRLLLSRS